jgi:hypothetical protein
MALDGMSIIMRNIHLMGQAGAGWVDGHLHCDDLSTTVLCWEREHILRGAGRGESLAAKKPGRYPYVSVWQSSREINTEVQRDHAKVTNRQARNVMITLLSIYCTHESE